MLRQDLSKIPKLFYLTAKAFEGYQKTDATEREVFLDKTLDFVYPKNSPLCERHGLTRALLLNLVESSLPQLPSPQHIFVGEVLSFEDGGTNGEITFMKRIRGKNVFVWEGEQIENVDAKFVFKWDVQLSSKNGRTCSLVEFGEIEESSKLYRDTYCSEDA